MVVVGQRAKSRVENLQLYCGYGEFLLQAADC